MDYPLAAVIKIKLNSATVLCYSHSQSLLISVCFLYGFCLYIGVGQEALTSISDLDIEPDSETECRDRGLGGTMEDNTEECFLETPMMSAANQTGDSSCPLWLRKARIHESRNFSLEKC